MPITEAVRQPSSIALWTLSAQMGVSGREVATRISERAGVPLYDDSALLEAALERGLEALAADESALATRVGGRLEMLGLQAAIAAGSTDAMQELRLRQELPEVARVLIRETARPPGVVLAAAGFAALRNNPAAIHIRLRASRDWRIASYARDNLVDRGSAKRAIQADDRKQRKLAWLLGGVDIEDPRAFSMVLDVSQFTTDRLVELLLSCTGF
jgi:hypothetical protein